MSYLLGLKTRLSLSFASVLFLIAFPGSSLLPTHSKNLRAVPAVQVGFSDCRGGQGGQLFSTGGFAQVTTLPGTADFASDLRLSYAGNTIAIATAQEIGKTLTLPKIDFTQELVFKIFVRDTGETFSMGPASRNRDGISHAIVQCLGEGRARVSFEDNLGGGDRDYDDVQFEIRASNTEMIDRYGECGEHTVKGTLSPRWGNLGSASAGTGPQILESNAGEKLELQCFNAKVPSFKLFYTPPNGTRARVGMCPFEAGCNTAFFSYSGITNGKPDRFLRTLWRSRDYGDNDRPNPWTGQNDGNPEVLDHAISTFYARTQNLIKTDYKYEYRIGPPVNPRFCGARRAPEGRLLAIQTVDPIIGPETEAFFDGVDRLMQAGSPAERVMVESPFSFADLNRDGIVDENDLHIFQSAIGSCFGATTFNLDADFDGDSCITSSDEEAYLGLFNSAPNNQSPQARCKNIEVIADDSCMARIRPSDVNDGSSDPEGDKVTLSLDTTGPFGLGQHPVTLTVTDSHGATSSCMSTVTVVDKTPPTITGRSVDRPKLWPPDHRMVNVTVNYRANDNCGSVASTLSVTSNEPVSGTGDDDRAPDWQVIDSHHLALRAERAGNGHGRIYTITIHSTDSAGNSTSKRLTVLVPKSQGDDDRDDRDSDEKDKDKDGHEKN
jgi:hypothetical protein